jgi:hypothetical protein
MKKILTACLSAAVILGLTACGQKGFDANSSNTSAPEQTGQGSNGNNNSDLQKEMDKLDMSGYASGNYADGQETINLDKVSAALVLRIPLGFLVNVTLTANSFPEMPGVVVTTEFDPQKGQILVLRLPVKYLLRNTPTAAPSRLPNGDALPSVPSGELPMVALVLNAKKSEKIYLYLSKEYFAVFFETPVDFGSLLNPLLPVNPISLISIPIKDKNKVQIVGYLHLIAKKNSFNGGFMMAFRLPSKVAALLDDYFVD